MGPLFLFVPVSVKNVREEFILAGQLLRLSQKNLQLATDQPQISAEEALSAADTNIVKISDDHYEIKGCTLFVDNLFSDCSLTFFNPTAHSIQNQYKLELFRGLTQSCFSDQGSAADSGSKLQQWRFNKGQDVAHISSLSEEALQLAASRIKKYLGIDGNSITIGQVKGTPHFALLIRDISRIMLCKAIPEIMHKLEVDEEDRKEDSLNDVRSAQSGAADTPLDTFCPRGRQ